MLYRRHYEAREVPASERFAEGTAPAEGATYDDTTQGLTIQEVTGDGAATGRKVADERPVEDRGDGAGGTPDVLEDGTVSEDAYTGDELREMARELEVPTSGTKSELVERINAKLAEQASE